MERAYAVDAATRGKIVRVTTVLSIQSHVSYGHAGNSSAVFPLQRRGIEVWPVHTVTFSNHTGYGDWEGPLIPAEDIAAVIRGVDRRGALARTDAVLSGYLGGEEVGDKILEAVALVKDRNPKALYCCDTVMGDIDRGFYVRPGIPEFFRDRVAPAADVLTPNHFELNFLVGRDATTLDEVVAGIEEMRAKGPRTILVTSVETPDVSEGSLAMIAADDTGVYRVETPELDRKFTGSGDLTAAVFLSELLAGHPLDTALEQTAGAVFGVLAATAEAERSELMIVGAQEEIAAPSRHFNVTKL